MNVLLPEKEKIGKKRIFIYVIATIICILAIGIVIGIQVLGDDVINNLFGVSKLVKRTEQEEAQLKSNFENIFDNKFYDKGNYITQKRTTHRKSRYKYQFTIYKYKKSKNTAV